MTFVAESGHILKRGLTATRFWNDMVRFEDRSSLFLFEESMTQMAFGAIFLNKFLSNTASVILAPAVVSHLPYLEQQELILVEIVLVVSMKPVEPHHSVSKGISLRKAESFFIHFSIRVDSFRPCSFESFW